MRRFAYFAALGACASAMLTAPAGAQTRGVLELFTSQGCSSCPPADKLLGELMADPTLVVFSLPVDYWDSLGWKDTLADPRNTARQRAYARVRGERGVYTPQAVIDGTAHVVGSDKAAIQRALKSADLPVRVTAAVSGGTLSVNVPAGKAAGEVWVYTLAKEVPVAVGRGENRGRTVTYHNVARRWQKLGDYNGQAASFDVPVSGLAVGGADTAAVLVQSGTADDPGAMLGAVIALLR